MDFICTYVVKHHKENGLIEYSIYTNKGTVSVSVCVCVRHFFLEIHMFFVTSSFVISVMQLSFQIILS